MNKSLHIIVVNHKDIPWHMTPLENQVCILDYLRNHYDMGAVDLHDGTININGLSTDINKAAYFALKDEKPSN
jgi:hypothetical protein